MSKPCPVPYEYALSVLIDRNIPAPCPFVVPLTAFLADVFGVTREEVKAAVDQGVADHERNAAAYAAQLEGQTEADIYGDNALED